MDADALIDDICGEDPDRAAVALQAAHGRGDELTPKIIERLSHALAVGRDPNSESVPFVGFLFFLAAEFRARPAHALLVELLRLSEESLYDLLGDVVTGGAETALADTYDGSPQHIFNLIDDSSADPFARGAGLSALAMLWKRGDISREVLLSRMSSVISLLNPGVNEDTMVANTLVETAVAVNAHEIRDRVLALYERYLADEIFYEFEYVEQHLAPDAAPASEAAELDETISDAWARLQNWSFFTGEPEDEFEWEAGESGSDLIPPAFPPEDLYVGPPAALPFRAAPKPGRNDPCPCGSGKKYKKCCGR